MRRAEAQGMLTWVAGLAVREGDREGLLGDLLEERRLRAARLGEREGARWYRRQVLRSLGPMLWTRVRHAAGGGGRFSRFVRKETPSLLVAAGIIVAQFVTKHGATEGWLVLAGPTMLGLAFVVGDAMQARWRGGVLRPSAGAWIVGVASVLSGAILASMDPVLVQTQIAALGAAGWCALVLRAEGRRGICAGA